MTEWRLNISVILINVDGLNSPVKKKIFNLDHKSRPNDMVYIR